jgi:hypothetical protein
MEQNKLETISNLFENSEIRSVWDKDKEDYYFSVVDVIAALTESPNPRKYWDKLKQRLNDEGSELVTNCYQLKLEAPDGKNYKIDMLNIEGVFRLIESVSSAKAEPYKRWLARLASERIDEIFDPSKGIERVIEYYLYKGYTLERINNKMVEIIKQRKIIGG